MRNTFLIICCVALAMAGCKEVDKFTQFNMEYDETFVIPSSTGVNLPVDIFTPDIETNSESTFAVNDTRKDLVEEIKLTSLNLSIASPADADFSFLKSISIFISAEGLEETRIAWKENISDNIGSTLNLDVTNDDLKAYIKKDNFTLRLNTVTDELISSDHEIDMHSVFFVDAEIMGV